MESEHFASVILILQSYKHKLPLHYISIFNNISLEVYTQYVSRCLKPLIYNVQMEMLPQCAHVWSYFTYEHEGYWATTSNL